MKEHDLSVSKRDFTYGSERKKDRARVWATPRGGVTPSRIIVAARMAQVRWRIKK